MPSPLTHLDVILRPDPSRTVVRPFAPDYPEAFRNKDHSRVQVIVDRILGLDHKELCRQYQGVTDSLNEHHRDVDGMLLRRFDDIAKQLPENDARNIGEEQRRLIGAYFSEEYSFEAAALFNPSIVMAPDQSDAPPGGIRFGLALRGIGEGHVSSVTFRTGSWVPGGPLVVDKPSAVAVAPIVEATDGEDGARVHLSARGSENLSETVIFPVLPSQRQGIEDMRLVRFCQDNGEYTYYGTYTAYDGRDARSELFIGRDFRTFDMRPLEGSQAQAKGMALFPRKVNGQYMMLGRQDSESVWLLRSDSLYRWDGGDKLISPKYPWEFVQMGNCGSPIEIDEGWLVLTHGVGTVRNYCMGAALLDKEDPSKVLKRTSHPLLAPSPNERDGYVPNVVYSCGALVHDRTLLLPYGVADNFSSFATCAVDDLLAAME
jgi:predicted GH43/DUF377 family glycosyl hydrolase